MPVAHCLVSIINSIFVKTREAVLVLWGSLLNFENSLFTDDQKDSAYFILGTSQRSICMPFPKGRLHAMATELIEPKTPRVKA